MKGRLTKTSLTQNVSYDWSISYLKMASCANTFLEQIAAYFHHSVRDVINISNQTTHLL